VPSIFIVAPKGNTKEEAFWGTRFFLSTHSMVKGRVAELEEVENAVVRAELILKR
jgi:hypothetical protein